MKRLSLSARRSFVRRHTRLSEIEDLPGIRLHLADEVEGIWRATEEITGTGDQPIPYWAFAWAGGLALARYLQANPDEVRGRRVLDFATGSGLVALVASRLGATHVAAADIDPFAEAAVAVNARVNAAHVAFVRRDLLDEPPPDVDVLLAADTWYEGTLAERVLPWLQAAATRGTRVLVGDPGRKYFPDAERAGLEVLRLDEVHTTTTLEDRELVAATVYALAPPAPRTPPSPR